MKELRRLAVRETLDGGEPVVALETTSSRTGSRRAKGSTSGWSRRPCVARPAQCRRRSAVLDGGVGRAQRRRARAVPEAPTHGRWDPATSPPAWWAGAVGATTVGGTLAAGRRAGIRVLAYRRHRRRAPRLAGPGPTCRPTSPSSRGSGDRRVLRREVPARRRGHGRAAGDARRAGPRVSAPTSCRCLTGGARRAADVDTVLLVPPRRRPESLAAHWQLGWVQGSWLANPPAESLDDVEPLIEEGLAEAARD